MPRGASGQVSVTLTQVSACSTQIDFPNQTLSQLKEQERGGAAVASVPAINHKKAEMGKEGGMTVLCVLVIA